MAESLSTRTRNVSGGILLTGALGITGLLHVNERNYNDEVERRAAVADVTGNIMPLISPGNVPSKDTLVDGLEINTDSIKDITPTGNVIDAVTGSEQSLDASEDLDVTGYRNRWKFVPLGTAAAIIGIRSVLRRRKEGDTVSYSSSADSSPTANRLFATRHTVPDNSLSNTSQRVSTRKNLIERWEEQQLSEGDRAELNAYIAALKAQATPLMQELDRHGNLSRNVEQKRAQYNQLVRAAQEALTAYNTTLTEQQSCQAEVTKRRDSFITKLGNELTLAQAEAILGLDLHSDRRLEHRAETHTQPGIFSTNTPYPMQSQYEHLRSAFDTAEHPSIHNTDTDTP